MLPRLQWWRHMDGLVIHAHGGIDRFGHPVDHDIGKQLIHERINKARKARRRTYQTVLGFDVFMKLLATKKPDFCCFFTNHVASAMHRYWAAAYPEHFQDQTFTEEWTKDYKDEINFSMQKADAFLKKLIFLNLEIGN